MTNELKEKLGLLAHLIQHATAKDYGVYLELDDWFYEYKQSATSEEKSELSREIKKLYPMIHQTLVELAVDHAGSDLGKESQEILEQLPILRKGGTN